jgi:hypothetical protein
MASLARKGAGRKYARAVDVKNDDGLRGVLRSALVGFVVDAGVAKFRQILDDEITALAGPKSKKNPDRTAVRWATAQGAFLLGGRKVPLKYTRLRTKDGRREIVPLAAGLARRTDLLGEHILSQIFGGLAGSRYGESLQAPEIGYGATRSSVSRHVAVAGRAALDRLMSRDLSDLQLVALMIDGLSFAETTVVAALGIDKQGRKHPLGVWDGATENATVCKELLANLIDRGLVFRRGLVVIDGSKALRKAVRDTWGDEVLVQRCRIHKMRNLLDHLPKKRHGWARRLFWAAMAEKNADRAAKALAAFGRLLEKESPSAASSLREGIDELLTTKRLGLPDAIERAVSTTNLLESALAQVRGRTRNIKRWRGGAMILRWAGAAFEHAGKRWNRIRGHREIPFLLAALEKHFGVTEQAKVA